MKATRLALLSANNGHNVCVGSSNRLLHIGRSKHVDITIDSNAYCSRLHCAVRVSRKNIYIKDLSANGCFLKRGNKCINLKSNKWTQVKENDAISLGDPNVTDFECVSKDFRPVVTGVTRRKINFAVADLEEKSVDD